MSARIAQHRHCRQCGKAFVGNEPFCSGECKSAHSDLIRKKKNQLNIFYLISIAILVLVVVFSVAS